MSNKNARARMRAAQVAEAAKKRRRRIIVIVGIVVVVVAAAVAITIAIAQSRHAPGSGQVQPPNANSDNTAIAPFPGTVTAEAPLVEFYFDYQCPGCKQVEQFFGAEFDALAKAGEIRLEYHTLTFMDGWLGNDSSVSGAIAAACADTVGKYSDFHNEIFANQPPTEGDGYDKVLLRETIPATVGITGEQLISFQRCYDTRATEAFVATVNETGDSDDIRTTPTIRVNGKDFDPNLTGNDPSKLGQVIQDFANTP